MIQIDLLTNIDESTKHSKYGNWIHLPFSIDEDLYERIETLSDIKDITTGEIIDTIIKELINTSILDDWLLQHDSNNEADREIISTMICNSIDEYLLRFEIHRDVEVNNEEFEVILIRDEESDGYVVYVPKLKGCLSQGETIDETIENIKDALSGFLELESPLNQNVEAF